MIFSRRHFSKPSRESTISSVPCEVHVMRLSCCTDERYTTPSSSLGSARH